MPSKTYTEEFKRDAVALYENSSSASLTTIATDLGINRATLHNWVKRYRDGRAHHDHHPRFFLVRLGHRHRADPAA